jgi:hypothetical protein
MRDQTETTGLSAPAPATLKYEPEAFRGYVKDMDLTSAQQDALLETVWLVVVGVIDMGLGLKEAASSDSNPLAADSSSVLALLSTSKTSKPQDVRDSEPSTRRTDS